MEKRKYRRDDVTAVFFIPYNCGQGKIGGEEMKPPPQFPLDIKKNLNIDFFFFFYQPILTILLT